MSAATTVIAAGALATSAYSAYNQGKGPKGASTSYAPPGYISDAGQFAVGRGKEIANRPYTPFEGTRVAGLSPNEQLGTQMATGAALSGDSRRYLDKAGALTDEAAGSTWNSETAKKYMDPYIGGVVDQALKKENEAYSGRQAALKANSAKVGAFGGDRATLLESAETGRHLDTVGDITSKGYSQAYGQAVNTWMSDNQRRLQSADAYRAVGGDIANLNSSQITDLLRTGQTGRLLEQADLDFDYQQFIENRDWSVNNLQPLLAAMGAGSQGGTQTYNPAGGSKTAAMLGALSTIVGYYGGQQADTGYTPTPSPSADAASAAGVS
jgi:hypothetical protein